MAKITERKGEDFKAGLACAELILSHLSLGKKMLFLLKLLRSSVVTFVAS